MTYKYEQKTGKFWNPDGTLLDTGYAGRGAGRNNPEMQGVRDTGPLPQGKYKIGGLIPYHKKLGYLVMSLTPQDETVMLGRSAFYIHGDNVTHDASHGCIILGRAARLALGSADANHNLKVVA